MLEIVKNLSPVIRADGYHILSDATGVPDLYAHIGPTLRRLLPWRRREPSALTGRARALVTAWVLVIVPILLSMAFSAILLFPKLAASSWESGSHIVSAIPGRRSGVLRLLASVVRLFALALPVLGAALLVGRLVRSTASKALGAGAPAGRRAGRCARRRRRADRRCSRGRGGRPASTSPVRPTDDGTLVGAFRTVSAPAAVARPRGAAAAPRLAPGRHLAIALIPRGGPTKEHPALFVVKGATATSRRSSSARRRPTPATPRSSRRTSAGRRTPRHGQAAAPRRPRRRPPRSRSSCRQARARTTPRRSPPTPRTAASSTTSPTRSSPSGGEPVDNENSAYALASCNACTTLAVSFQLVLVVGQSDRIMPINVAEALNLKCPAASRPRSPSRSWSRSSRRRRRSCCSGSPRSSRSSTRSTSTAAGRRRRQVNAVQDAIDQELDDSGITYPRRRRRDAGRDGDARRERDARRDGDTDRDGDADAHADGDRDPGAGPRRRPRPRRPPRRRRPRRVSERPGRGSRTTRGRRARSSRRATPRPRGRSAGPRAQP